MVRPGTFDLLLRTSYGPYVQVGSNVSGTSDTIESESVYHTPVTKPLPQVKIVIVFSLIFSNVIVPYFLSFVNFQTGSRCN